MSRFFTRHRVAATLVALHALRLVSTESRAASLSDPEGARPARTGKSAAKATRQRRALEAKAPRETIAALDAPAAKEAEPAAETRKAENEITPEIREAAFGARAVAADFEMARLRADIDLLTGVAAIDGRTLLRDRHTLENKLLVRGFLVERLRQLGLATSLESENPAPRFFARKKKNAGADARPIAAEIVNVLGEIRGTEQPDEVIEVSAHYDTIHEKVPGADDNGSGVVSALEIARLLTIHPPRKTVRFVFTDLEESGMQGADLHVRNLKAAKSQIVGAVVIDVIGYSDAKKPTFVVEAGDEYQHGFDADAYAANRAFSNLFLGQLKHFNDRATAHKIETVEAAGSIGDHGQWWDEHFPAIFVAAPLDQAHPQNHRAGDVAGSLNWPYFEDVARQTAEGVARLAGSRANATDREALIAAENPKFKPGRDFVLAAEKAENGGRKRSSSSSFSLGSGSSSSSYGGGFFSRAYSELDYDSRFYGSSSATAKTKAEPAASQPYWRKSPRADDAENGGYPRSQARPVPEKSAAEKAASEAPISPWKTLGNPVPGAREEMIKLPATGRDVPVLRLAGQDPSSTDDYRKFAGRTIELIADPRAAWTDGFTLRVGHSLFKVDLHRNEIRPTEQDERDYFKVPAQHARIPGAPGRIGVVFKFPHQPSETRLREFAEDLTNPVLKYAGKRLEVALYGNFDMDLPNLKADPAVFSRMVDGNLGHLAPAAIIYYDQETKP